MNDTISLVSGVLVMILILLMAYFFSRFLGRHWRGVGKGKYMEVVDHLVVGPDRELLIVRMEQEDKCILLGSGADGIRFLMDLSDTYPREANRGVYPRSFQDSMTEVMNKWKRSSKGDSPFDFGNFRREKEKNSTAGREGKDE